MDDKLKQVLHKVELLCEQNPEFAAALRNKLSVDNTMCSPTETAAFIKLQRKNMRQRGRLFYQNVKDKTLHYQLVNDYAFMLWYKCVGDIPHMFSHILFQMENMLNYFIVSQGVTVYEEVANNSDMYVYKSGNFTCVTKEQFFDAKGNKKPIENIGIWAKYTYWFVSTQQPDTFRSYTHSLVSDVINFRNITEHRNAQKEIPEWMNEHLDFWTINIEQKYSYIDMFLSIIRETIKKL